MTALSAPTAEDAWALRSGADLASGTPSSAILRYHNGEWAAEATFPGASLSALSMDSPEDGWSAGGDGAGPFLLHYAHGAWSRVIPSAQGGISAMTGPYMASPSVGWATGFVNPPSATCTECGGPQSQQVVLRFHNGGWQQVQQTFVEAEGSLYTGTQDSFLPDAVAAGADGSGWVARGHLVS